MPEEAPLGGASSLFQTQGFAPSAAQNKKTQAAAQVYLFEKLEFTYPWKMLSVKKSSTHSSKSC
jgi:hypothetical protein